MSNTLPPIGAVRNQDRRIIDGRGRDPLGSCFPSPCPLLWIGHKMPARSLFGTSNLLVVRSK